MRNEAEAAERPAPGMAKVAVALCAVLALSGCETLSYYAQAAHGEYSILSSAEPVDKVVADPSTPEALRERLKAAESIRNFASRELGLPNNDTYRRYAALGRPYAVWNVVATPEFSLKPIESCFPVAGCVSYRGYFTRADAAAYGARLRARGDDVIVYGVPAFSTLGWFDDPLLSTFIRYPETELAHLLFHELTHQLIYVKGDTTFDESLAETVAAVGVRRWLVATGRGAELASYLEARKRMREFAALLARTRGELESLYAQPVDATKMRARKRAAFEQLMRRYAALKQSWGGYQGYDRLLEGGPNNALIASFETYTAYVPGFEALLTRSDGDLEKFYAKVRALAALPKAERDRELENLASARSSRGPS
jgi:predicted aminopeptidase